MPTITRTEQRPAPNTLTPSELFGADLTRAKAAAAAYNADKRATGFEAQVEMLNRHIDAGTWEVRSVRGVNVLVNEEGDELALLDWRIGRLGDRLCMASQRTALAPGGITEAAIEACFNRRWAAKRGGA